MRLYTFFITFWLIVFGLLQPNAYAQKFTFEFSDEVKTQGMSYIDYFVGKIGDNYYAIRTRGYQTIYLEKYDGKMSLIYSNKLNFKEEGYRAKNLKRVVELEGNVYCLFAEYDGKTKKGKYLAVTLDLKKGEFGNKEIVLDEFIKPEKATRGTFSGIVNEEHNKLLVYQDVPNDKKGKDQVSIKVFDAKLDLISKVESSLPYTDKNSNIEDFVLAKDLTLYLLVKVDKAAKEIDEIADQKKENDSAKKRTSKIAYTILSFPVDTDSYEEYVINLKDKFITDIKLNVDEDNNLITAGFYADKANPTITFSFGTNYISGDIIAGYFLHKVNGESKEVMLSTIVPFSKEFLEEMRQDRAAASKKGIRSFDIRNIQVNKDGGFTIVAEQFFVQKITTTSSHTTTNTTHVGGGGDRGGGYTRTTTSTKTTSSTNVIHHYNHILVMSFDKDGKQLWNCLVPKKQTFVNRSYSMTSYTDGFGGGGRGLGLAWNSTGGGNKVTSGFPGLYASFYLVTDEDNKIYLFYNDVEKNLTINSLKKVKSLTNPKKGMVVMATIDRNGKLTRSPVFSSKEEKVVFYPRTGYTSNDQKDKDIVFSCKRGKKEKLVKVKLK